MHDVIFYIFFIMILLTVPALSFSRSNINANLYFITAIFALAGLFTMLHFELIAVIILIGISVISAVYVLLKKYFIPQNTDDVNDYTGSAIIVIIISLLTAVLAGLASSTRIENPAVLTGIQNYSIIFNKYLPVILLTVVLLSVVSSFALTLIRKEDAD